MSTRKAAAVFLLAVMCGCTIPTKVSSEDARTALSEITYAKDSRTGLCFALISSSSKDGWNVISFTNVACDKVTPAMLSPAVPSEQ